MADAVPETGKTPGVYYALTEDGIELPIVDVTHPAFAMDITQADLDQRFKDHVRELDSRTHVPQFIQNIVLGFMVKRSRIMRGIQAASGGFMSGMDTYLLKLGPENLGSFASHIDRQISGSLPGVAVRIRLQDLAHLLANGLLPALSARAAAPLHLLNIGGGPAIDSLNALLVLHKEHSHLLAGRSISIHILDLDEAGPRFGQRALTSLQADGAPLHGLEVGLERVRYDWSATAPLSELLHSFPPRAVVAASSEGALFEYGSDADIASNLRLLHEAAPADAVVVGTVTRADEIGRVLNGSSRAALQMRGIDNFSTLVQSAGWRIAERIDRPMSHDVCLQKM